MTRSARCGMKTKPCLEVALWVMLLLIPLVIGLAWGTLFDDGAYVTFRCARNLAAGRGLTHGSPKDHLVDPDAPVVEEA